jgi:hypothetical protein
MHDDHAGPPPATLDTVLAEVRDLRAQVDTVPDFLRNMSMALADLTMHIERLCIAIEGGHAGQRRP